MPAASTASAAQQQQQPCAECIIQIRLTSGQNLEGGFYASETVNSVYEFLQSSVVNADGEALLLRAPAGGSHVDFDTEVRCVTH